jgi:hypothetical protein
MKGYGTRWGVLFQPLALWIGAHYSGFSRRWCINVLPCVTLWICRDGGKVPDKACKMSPVALYRQRMNGDRS